MVKNKNPELKKPFGESFSDAWNEWMQYRKERRLPAYKPTGLKRTFTGIMRDSDNDEKTACEMIFQAIEKNWQGIFPLIKKVNGNNIITNGSGLSKAGRSEINDQARSNY